MPKLISKVIICSNKCHADLGYCLPLHFLFTKLPNVYYRPTILTKEKGGNYERTNDEEEERSTTKLTEAAKSLLH